MSENAETVNIDVVEIRSSPSVWTKEEHTLMLLFMEQRRDFLFENIQRNIAGISRSNKAQFFVSMSKTVGTKSDKQCKSRYQKKERQLLKEMDFPFDMVEEYIKSKMEKNKKSKKRRDSPQSTEACVSMVKPDDPPSNSINSFEELRSILLSEFMPRVLNDVVRTHLQNFIQSFPTDETLVRQMPSLDISPFRLHQPSMGFSIDIIQDPEIIFLEDCD